MRLICILLFSFVFVYGCADDRNSSNYVAPSSSAACNYTYDAAGGYKEIRGEKIFNTGVSFQATVYLTKSSPHKFTGDLIDDNNEEHDFKGRWLEKGVVFGKTDDGSFVEMEIIGSVHSGECGEEGMRFLNSIIIDKE